MGSSGQLLPDSVSVDLGSPRRLVYGKEFTERPVAVARLMSARTVSAGTQDTDRRLYEACKRFLDVVITLLLLILTAPVTMLAALAIKANDGGPVLYVHTRVGKKGKEFTCYKFRSMIVEAHRLQVCYQSANRHADHRTFKLEDDPRVTWIGRILRRLSIDELPQLLNVLRGDMSIVGPRPPVPDEVKLYTDADWRRLDVRPGLTCIWQVSGRSNLPFPEQLRMDMEYVQHRSLLLDFKLLMRTIPAVISCRGAW